MLDPLTALGLASSIVQLVTFMGDLLSKSRAYYKFCGWVPHRTARARSNNCQPSKAERRPHRSNGRKFDGDPNRTTTQRACGGCKAVSKELLDVIRDLKSKGSNKKRQSFRQALKSIWQEDKINALEARLGRYRSQIDTTLLISLRESIDRLPSSERESKEASKIVLQGRSDAKSGRKSLLANCFKVTGNFRTRRI
jgi:hypothetical protein